MGLFYGIKQYVRMIRQKEDFLCSSSLPAMSVLAKTYYWAFSICSPCLAQRFWCLFSQAWIPTLRCLQPALARLYSIFAPKERCPCLSVPVLLSSASFKLPPKCMATLRPARKTTPRLLPIRRLCRMSRAASSSRALCIWCWPCWSNALA